MSSLQVSARSGQLGNATDDDNGDFTFDEPSGPSPNVFSPNPASSALTVDLGMAKHAGSGSDGEDYGEHEDGEEEGEEAVSEGQEKLRQGIMKDMECWEAGEAEEYEGEEEETPALPISVTTSVIEKLRVDEREPEEPAPLLADITAEVSAERQALLDKLKDTFNEYNDLRRKNRVYELYVYRHLEKSEEKILPADEDGDSEEAEQIYREALQQYKLQVDDMVAQQAQLKYEFESYKDKMQAVRDEDTYIFGQFLDQVRETSVGLVYAKTGKKLTDKTVEELIQRQVSLNS